jgi:mRNA-degrading endonuclease RelE of RelBE toxin-antitoxin system
LKAKRYRIVYRPNDAEMTVEILLVGHRRDVYETLRSLLTGV